MNSIRRETVRAFLEEHKVATLEQLSGLFPEVSLMTLHRDLNYLQAAGYITKVRGGARYNDPGALEPAFDARAAAHPQAKRRIADKAVGLLQGVSSLFLDAGTTTMALARQLPDREMSVVTTGPNIALELAKGAEVSVNLCGGLLNKSNLTISGTPALQFLEGINIDTAVLVASGYSAQGGFTCGREGEARIKELVLGRARRTILLMDHSKLDRVLPYTFGTLREIHTLVTDLAPDALPEELARSAGELGVRVI